jgi:hypothetical protein
MLYQHDAVEPPSGLPRLPLIGGLQRRRRAIERDQDASAPVGADRTADIDGPRRMVDYRAGDGTEAAASRPVLTSFCADNRKIVVRRQIGYDSCRRPSFKYQVDLPGAFRAERL